MRSLPLPGRRLAVAVGALVAVGLAASAMTASASSQHSTASSTLVVDKSFDLKTSDPQRQFEPTGGIVDHALYDTLLTFKGADVVAPDARRRRLVQGVDRRQDVHLHSCARTSSSPTARR